MKHLQKQTLEGTEIMLTDKDQNYLGPDLVLQRCHLILRTNARALTITNVQLLDCQVEAKKKLVNFQMWCGAVIKGCTFRGQFVGNDFGHWTEQHPNGSIENCDFSDAVLDGCRFMDCDIDSIKLPKWPCFTIVYPQRRRSELESLQWPGEVRIWATVVAQSIEITAASVGHAPTLAKQFSCTEEELREALIRLGNVLM